MSKVEALQKDEAVEKGPDAMRRLIAEQGVTPVDNLDELAALWPADDDPDALMKYVLSERRARLELNPEDRRSK